MSSMNRLLTFDKVIAKQVNLVNYYDCEPQLLPNNYWPCTKLSWVFMNAHTQHFMAAKGKNCASCALTVFFITHQVCVEIKVNENLNLTAEYLKGETR